jgi:myo-inositol-1(or 4)-monophosphatase
VVDLLTELIEIAKGAAQAGAAIHSAYRQSTFDVREKHSATDLVTDIDQESERKITSVIRAARPQDAIIAEEGTDVSGQSSVCWIIDPLDGTTNFVHGYPAHAVSIGIEIDGKPAGGVVHDTFHDHVYSGIVGVGAERDGHPLAARRESTLSRALIGTGFLPNAEVRRVQAEVLKAVLPLVRDVRRSGCPSLDICAVASGALDGFYECGLGRWDTAAGAAIAEAAGAKVVQLHSNILPNPLLVVANPVLLDSLIDALFKAGALDSGAI